MRMTLILWASGVSFLGRSANGEADLHVTYSCTKHCIAHMMSTAIPALTVENAAWRLRNILLVTGTI